MRVESIELTEIGLRTRATATVQSVVWSQPREVWFELPSDFAVPAALMSADIWLASLLLPAMLAHEDLFIDAPVSPDLLRSVDQIQEIYRAWLPATRRVEVHTNGVRVPQGTPQYEGSYFSCGVDSWYSMLRLLDSSATGRHPGVTHLITVHGADIDFGTWKADVADAVLANSARVSREFGLGSVAVSTNLRQIYTGVCLSWHWGQAGGLSAIALALQDSFRHVSVASGATNASLISNSSLEAGGCHPLLLPLFSTALCELSVHGGDVTRLQKVERVAECDLAMETLRVCWASHRPEYNCGRCAKCVRTSLELAIVGALDRCVTLPSELDPESIGRIQTMMPSEVGSLVEHHELLAAGNASAEVLDALQVAIDRARRQGEERQRAIETIRAVVADDEFFVVFDEDEIRYEVSRTHARSRPFTAADGIYNGLPLDDAQAIDELAQAREAGATKLVVWMKDFWALDYYAGFHHHVQTTGQELVATPEVRIFDLAVSPR